MGACCGKWSCACKKEELRAEASRLGMQSYGCISGACAGMQHTRRQTGRPSSAGVAAGCRRLPPCAACTAPPLPAPTGFRDFVMRGNVVDLAVAIVVGSSFTGECRAGPHDPVVHHVAGHAWLGERAAPLPDPLPPFSCPPCSHGQCVSGRLAYAAHRCHFRRRRRHVCAALVHHSVEPVQL